MSQSVLQMVGSRENESEESDAEEISQKWKKYLYCHFERTSSIHKLHQNQKINLVIIDNVIHCISETSKLFLMRST